MPVCLSRMSYVAVWRDLLASAFERTIQVLRRMKQLSPPRLKILKGTQGGFCRVVQEAVWPTALIVKGKRSGRYGKAFISWDWGAHSMLPRVAAGPMASRPCLRELLIFSNLGPLNQIPSYSRTWVARGRNCRKVSRDLPGLQQADSTAKGGDLSHFKKHRKDWFWGRQ